MKTRLFKTIVILSVILISCKKQEVNITSTASLLVTNVVNGGGNLFLGTNSIPVYNFYFQSYGMLAGSQQIKLVDTVGVDRLYYDSTAELINGGVYSLFLTGSTNDVESVFIKEETIYQHAEDVFGVRVINLSTAKMSINVNLAGAEDGSFVSKLPFKAITKFKIISSAAIEGDKTFEIRDAVKGTLLATFTVPSYDMPRFANITLVFAGDATSAFIFRLNNY